MSKAMLCFSVRWAGSNKIIASKLLLGPVRRCIAWLNDIWLQEQVAALVNIDPQSIKILLGSPAGPQLTPVLFTLGLVPTDTKIEDLPLHKAMVKAWASLTTEQVYNVYVTQHSPVAIAVDKMARLFRSGNYQFNAFMNFPFNLQSNPVVALAALHARNLCYIKLPEELKTNKDFAFAAIEQTCGTHTVLNFLSFTLCDDEDVVLKAVARRATELWHVSKRLRRTKTFALNAVSVNGLCFKWVPLKLQLDKDVALAAVHQNEAALEYLCDTLRADKDIQEACKHQNSKTD